MRQSQPFKDVRSFIVFGAVVIASTIGGLGLWATTVDLSGAVLATGQVVVDTNIKKVQHASGGVVGAIYVKEGQLVKAGDLLIKLDDTVTRANLQMVSKILDEIAVRQTRLLAEHDRKTSLTFPITLSKRANEPLLAEIMGSETNLFLSRRAAREGLKSQLKERISQLHQEIDGLNAQRESRGKEFGFARAELEGLEILEERSLVSTPRITAARRSVAQLEGDNAQILAATAQARGKIAEIELQILQLDQDLKTEVGKDLRDQQSKQAEYEERLVAAEDQLKKIDIRSPQAGTVHQLSIHTVGGVIGQGETIMMIVPVADALVIDAQVAPQDIDQLYIGQHAQVRFSSFNQRTTPDLSAIVTRISADLASEHAPSPITEANIRSAFYIVRLVLDDASRTKLNGLKLLPGMPVEAHIATSSRNALSYFAKPISDQFSRAFRER